ncbi:hypothetical protein HN997_02825 [archaeon]|nr:hypothetical protein [archaeon]
MMALRKIGRRGATGWSMGKLLTAILAIILLALIIYGVSTGGINKLSEKLGGKFYEVMVMFGMVNETVSAGNGCHVQDKVLIYLDGAGQEVKGKLTLCTEYCLVDLEQGKGSFSFSPIHSTLSEKNEIYVVESGAWMEWAQFLESPTKKIYFYYFGEGLGWKWSPEGSSYSDWFSVDKSGSIETLAGEGKHAASYIRNEIISKLPGKNYDEGVVIIKGSISHSEIYKVYPDSTFVDIEHEVMNDKTSQRADFYDVLLEKSKQLTFESRWPDSDNFTHSGTKKMWIGWKGLRMKFDDGYSFALGPENGGGIFYLWELRPTPNADWIKWDRDTLKSTGDEWKVRPLNLYDDLKNALRKESNKFEFDGGERSFQLTSGGPDKRNLLGVHYLGNDGKWKFYGLDWENNLWLVNTVGGGWGLVDKKISPEVYDGKIRKDKEINKKIRDFLVDKCR